MADETIIGLSDTRGIIMSPWEVWNTLSPDMQYQISWFIGLCALGFLIVTVTVIFLLGSAIGSSSLQKDASGRNKYVGGLLWSAATMFGVIAAVAFVFCMFK